MAYVTNTTNTVALSKTTYSQGSGDQKSEAVSLVWSEMWQALSSGDSGRSCFLASPASRGFLHSWALGPFLTFKASIIASSDGHLALTVLHFSCKDLWNYVRPPSTQISQGHFPSQDPYCNHPCEAPLPGKVAYLQVLGLGCRHLRGALFFLLQVLYKHPSWPPAP